MGHLKNINFLFETNEKSMTLSVPILKHFRVTYLLVSLMSYSVQSQVMGCCKSGRTYVTGKISLLSMDSPYVLTEVTLEFKTGPTKVALKELLSVSVHVEHVSL